MHITRLYKKYFLKILSYRKDTGYKHYSVYPFILNWYILYYPARYLSAIITPVFILLNFSPNFVSIARYFICIASFFLLFNSDNITYRIIFFSLLMNYIILDFVDGDIARVQGRSTFYGRILDGWVDMQLQACIYLFSGYIIFKLTSEHNYLYASILVFFMVFISNLNIDRYASFRRWIKEEHKIDIGTHNLNNFLLSLRLIHSEIIFFNLIFGCFIININSLRILILYGLLWNIIYFLYFVYLQLNNVKSIPEKPKYDGNIKNI